MKKAASNQPQSPKHPRAPQSPKHPRAPQPADHRGEPHSELATKGLTLPDLRDAARVVVRLAQLTGLAELDYLATWLVHYARLAELAMAVPEDGREQFLAALSSKAGRDA